MTIDDMDIPGFRLHPLEGEMRGRCSIMVSGNWRLTFEFRDGNAYVLDDEYCHMSMHNPPHAGEFITDIYLEPNGISGRELAEKLDVGKRSINPTYKCSLALAMLWLRFLQEFTAMMRPDAKVQKVCIRSINPTFPLRGAAFRMCSSVGSSTAAALRSPRRCVSAP